MTYRIVTLPTLAGIRFYLIDNFGRKDRGGFARREDAEQKAQRLNYEAKKKSVMSVASPERLLRAQ